MTRDRLVDYGRHIIDAAEGDVDCNRCGGPEASGPIFVLMGHPDVQPGQIIPWYLCESCAESLCNWLERK